jgi:hypothetical protein
MNRIINIDPKKIYYYSNINKPRTNKFRRYLNRFPFAMAVPFRLILSIFDKLIVRNTELIPKQRFEETTTFKLMHDLIEKYPKVEYTLIYHHLSSQLVKDNMAVYKKNHLYSNDAIVSFIDGYYHDVVISLKTRGYEFKKNNELGSCVIGPNGDLIKSLYGRHRFSIARILEIKNFPLRVDYIDFVFWQKHHQSDLSFYQNFQRIIRLVAQEYN